MLPIHATLVMQRSSTLFLETHDPEEFSYSPNQTHLKQPIKLLKTVLKPDGNKLPGECVWMFRVTGSVGSNALQVTRVT